MSERGDDGYKPLRVFRRRGGRVGVGQVYVRGDHDHQVLCRHDFDALPPNPKAK